MKKNIQTVYGPEYLKNFQCTATNCEETCCKNWVINVDKDTYKKYKKVKDIELKEIIKSHISPNSIFKRGKYAQCKIHLDSDGFCPFLNKDFLCKMQLKYGAEYIPSICYIYPRIINVVDGKYEMSLNTSCMEAARSILLNKDPMEFVEIGEMDLYKNYIRATFDSDKALFLVWHKKYFHLYRDFAIKLFQNRSLKLFEKLLILGLFCVKVDKMFYSKKYSQISEFVTSFYEKTDIKAFINEYSRREPDYFYQITILKDLSDNLGSRNAYEKYVELYERMTDALGREEDFEMEEIVKRYKNSYQNYYKPFIDANQHFFENYLVNYVYKKLFPFYNSKGFNSLYDAFIILVIHYAIIKFHLVCSAIYQKEITEEMAVEVVFLFSRTFEHNQKYFTDVLSLLKRERHNDFKSMVKLFSND